MAEVKLPDGWQSTCLGNVVDYGKTTKCELKDVQPNTWILELEDIEKETSKVLKKVEVSERPFKSTKNRFSKGDVLYGKLRPYLNKIIVAGDDGVCTTEIVPLNGDPSIDNRILFYWMKGEQFLNFVTEVSYGVNMPRLGTKDGVVAPFVLPPFAEQKVIADKLDTLLAQVETTKARLDRIPQILKTFRQSVLAAAVSGKLTEEWRCTNNIGGWNSIILKDVANIIDPQPSHRTPPEYAGGFPYIGIGDLRDDGSIDFDRARKVSNEVLIEHKNRYQLKLGDFIFGKIGTLGKATILPIDREYTLSANVILIQPNDELVESSYLVYFLSSPTTMNEIANQATSTSQAAFGIKKMRAFNFNIPIKVEQTKIVHRVEQLFAHADKIEQQVQVAQQRVNKLTQSILAKAFRGELTTQWRKDNPKLISGENSAEALLAKIKAEREAKSPKKNVKTKKAKA
jgi:type I restriction enzyme S subunit